VFDCATCEFRQQVDALDAENANAWRCYSKMTRHRWVWEWQAGTWWVEQVFTGLDEDERDELMARVDVIYDALHPPQEKRRGA
jgi:hypothetical protein